MLIKKKKKEKYAGGGGEKKKREWEGKNDKKIEIISRIAIIFQDLNLYPPLRGINYQTVRKDTPEGTNRTY